MISAQATILPFAGKAPRIDPAAFVAPGARIIGDVEIQAHASVWYNCVLRAIRAEKSVGRAMASSKAFVCSDCVPPSTAANASSVVRTTLLYGSFSVSDTPDVWREATEFQPTYWNKNNKKIAMQI